MSLCGQGKTPDPSSPPPAAGMQLGALGRQPPRRHESAALCPRSPSSARRRAFVSDAVRASHTPQKGQGGTPQEGPRPQCPGRSAQSSDLRLCLQPGLPPFAALTSRGSGVRIVYFSQPKLAERTTEISPGPKGSSQPLGRNHPPSQLGVGWLEILLKGIFSASKTGKGELEEQPRPGHACEPLGF